MSEPRTLESKGKTIDEAIFNGLTEMGVSIDEVTIETVQQGAKGLLGIGAKPYIVRLTEKLNTFVVDMQPEPRKQPEPRQREQFRQPEARPAQAENTAATANEATVSEATASEAAQRPQRSEFRRNDRPPRRNDRRGPRPRQDRPEQRYEEEPREQIEYTKYVAGETECEGADFLLGMLERMGVQSELGFAVQPDGIRFKIESNSMGILIGYRGETLDAMQYITALVVNKGKEGYTRITLDTENYRNKREETLIRLARKIAAQVRRTGQTVELEPMNPYERRVLHFALQNNPYVTTYSQGDEPNRRVVIAAKR